MPGRVEAVLRAGRFALRDLQLLSPAGTDRLCEKKESKGRAGHPSDKLRFPPTIAIHVRGFK